MTMTLPQLIERIEELDAKTTKGPWTRVLRNLEAQNEPYIDRDIAFNSRAGTNRKWVEQGNTSLDFAAAARTLLPACARLLAVYERYAERLPTSWYVGLRDELTAELAKVIE